MKCPHCNKKLTLVGKDTPYLWCQRYQDNAIARTACCKKLINLTINSSFQVSKTTTENKEDDWGQ